MKKYKLYDPLQMNELSKDNKNQFLNSEKVIQKKEYILNYLNNSEVIIETLGIIPDVYSENGLQSQEYMGSGNYVSDGEWIWVDYLPYYVNKYNFDIPNDFIDMMSKSNWVPPKITAEEKTKIKNFIINYNLDTQENGSAR